MRWIGKAGIRSGCLCAALITIVSFAGCAVLRGPEVISANPVTVPVDDFETVWRQTVAAVDEYFDIRSENRLSRTIITDPVVGATIFEPWRGDSVGFDDRVESSLQSIRRFAVVRLEPAPGGSGYLVRVEVRKELEDLSKPERQVGGQKTVFEDVFPINRTREVVGPVALPSGWIYVGRDTKLEHIILKKIQDKLFL
jgi:hypothetical protein